MVGSLTTHVSPSFSSASSSIGESTIPPTLSVPRSPTPGGSILLSKSPTSRGKRLTRLGDSFALTVQRETRATAAAAAAVAAAASTTAANSAVSDGGVDAARYGGFGEDSRSVGRIVHGGDIKDFRMGWPALANLGDSAADAASAVHVGVDSDTGGEACSGGGRMIVQNLMQPAGSATYVPSPQVPLIPVPLGERLSAGGGHLAERAQRGGQGVAPSTVDTLNARTLGARPLLVGRSTASFSQAAGIQADTAPAIGESSEEDRFSVFANPMGHTTSSNGRGGSAARSTDCNTAVGASGGSLCEEKQERDVALLGWIDMSVGIR